MYTSEHVTSLCAFIRRCPTPFHTVRTVCDMLRAEGYELRAEGDDSPLREGGRYIVVRSDSSLIAFRYASDRRGFRIAAAHTDTPSFRVKPVAEKLCASYTGLQTERYGGMIYHTWLDRPLSVAGRVFVRTEDGVTARLLDIDRDLALIPSVAIHLNRTVNEGVKLNPAVDLIPLMSCERPSGAFTALVADTLGVAQEDIVSHDLFLYNREPGRVLGLGEDLLLCPRLDDLACVYTCLQGFLSADADGDAIHVLALFHNEEVGSSTKQGAASTFLADTLRTIAGDAYGAMLTGSLMVSADNAHAKHPNHPELSDPDHAPTLGGGVVIKYNASERYATDGLSDALFREICRRADVPVQSYCNRADLAGGSTLGSISNTRVGVPTVDIGIAQLAMHAARESCGVRDVDTMVRAMTAFFSTAMQISCSAATFS